MWTVQCGGILIAPETRKSETMDNPFGVRRRPRRPIINVTPLIDVMFLLLIFFMVSSVFPNQMGLDITLPEAASSTAQDITEHEILVTESGAIFLDEKQLDRNALQQSLKKLLAEEPEAVLVLRADKGANFQAVVSAMDAARSVGGTRLVIPTEVATRTIDPVTGEESLN